MATVLILPFFGSLKSLLTGEPQGAGTWADFPILTYSFFQIQLKHHLLLEALPGLTSLPKQESSGLLSIYSI